MRSEVGEASAPRRTHSALAKTPPQSCACGYDSGEKCPSALGRQEPCASVANPRLELTRAGNCRRRASWTLTVSL